MSNTPTAANRLELPLIHARGAWAKIKTSQPALLARKYWLPIAALVIAAGSAFVVISQPALPNVKVLALTQDPLYAAAGGDKPTMALALSVEFPTVGAQYRDTIYSDANEYLGYYDATSCYAYNNTPTEVATNATTYTNYKRFDRIGSATARKCTGTMDGFSGNFLNFASSSSIDMLRLALSGGDRLVDTGSSTSSFTILQRAVLPNGDPTCMWNNSGNFPAKSLPKDGGNYLGAVPSVMRTSATQALAGGVDIVIANTLNRIFFGLSTSSTSVDVPSSSCTNTGNYNLGGNAPSVIGPVVNVTQSLPGDASAACAGENALCGFSGVLEVWYGAGTKWAVAPANNGTNCSNAVFGDPIGGTAKSCYTRPYTGTWTPSGSGTLNSDGFFYARVQVCNVNAAKVLLDTRDYAFCTLQPNGFYKPTGSIQKYSDQLRLAAFGYLMDQTASYNTGGRYGGVLRAPMKYVGAKTFDTDGIDNTATNGNPNAEWDANTGVFAANPDGDTTQTSPVSGVINYLNKFGRTGPVPGRYKKFDPVGELYGEALRYLQGLGPTAEAVSNLTTDMYDGFPVFANWTDPYGAGRSRTADYSCLKTNIVVVADNNTHDSNRLLNRAADMSSNLPDFSFTGSGWNKVVQDFESNNTATLYIDGQGVSRRVGNPNTRNTNSPSAAKSIMGQAYWAHTQDIRGTAWTASPSLQRPGLRAKSFFFDVNEGSSANNSNFRRNENQFFIASKYGGFESDPSNPLQTSYNTYGNPFTRQDGTVDNNVWQDDANPGEASTYYLSSSARATLSAFDAIFSRAASSARSIAKSAVSNKNLTSVGSNIYQGAFDTSNWTGDVLATTVRVTSTSTVSIDPVPLWSAADRLQATTAAARTIVIGRTGTTANPTASNFVWASLDEGMKINLNRLTPGSAADGLGADRLNYLRGDRSLEGAPFRTRSKLLGDIVSSGIAFSGTPTTNISPVTNAYRSFFSTAQSRVSTVFVGANDGMLHAFNASNGNELFGYIPSWMGPKLSALTDNAYNRNHQAYVDATPVVGEAQLGTAGTAADWKTVLVGGTGAGGPGVYALDVTDPTAFSPSSVLWEFTKDDDADMGFVVGRPKIVKIRTNAYNVTPATYRWFAVVASGVNNYVPFPNAAGVFSTTGNPALFLLALDKPAGTAWTATGGSPNYYKLTLPVDATLSPTNPTGLINFEAVLGRSKEVAQMYMGDLHGKVWKLDFSLSLGSTQWTFDKLSYYIYNLTAYPMYIAKTAAGVIQPITMAPFIFGAAPLGNVATSYVSFGTGKYLEVADKTSTAQNSFYTIYDDGTTSATAGGASIPGRGRLIASTATVATPTSTISTPAFKWGRPTSDTDASKRAGWYIDYAGTGEKSISTISSQGDLLRWGSLIPAAAGTVGSCAASGGSGNIFEVNADTGVGVFRVSTVGVFGETLSFEMPGADVYGNSTTTGKRYKINTQANVYVGSTGIGLGAQTKTPLVTGRLSWRQINNYQDLKAAP